MNAPVVLLTEFVQKRATWVVATVLKSCAPTGPLVSDRFVLTENPVQPVPDWLTAVLEQLTITKRTAAVLMSPNFHYDRKVLESLLVTDVPYIGMLCLVDH